MDNVRVTIEIPLEDIVEDWFQKAKYETIFLSEGNTMSEWEIVDHEGQRIQLRQKVRFTAERGATLAECHEGCLHGQLQP